VAAVRSLSVGLHLLSWLIGVLETWLFLEVLQIPTSLVTGWLSTSTWTALEAGPASRLTAIREYASRRRWRWRGCRRTRSTVYWIRARKLPEEVDDLLGLTRILERVMRRWTR
jgi:hypothetical protein